MAKPKCMARAPHTSSVHARATVSLAPTCAITSLWHSLCPTNSTAGRSTATVGPTAPYPRATLHPKSSVIPISTTTELGLPLRTTGRYGSPLESIPVGFLTAMDIGRGSIRGGGRGSTTSRGALRPSTTDAGRLCVSAGAGCQVRALSDRSTLRRWSPLSAETISVCRLLRDLLRELHGFL